ncbi:MAG: hypothetical protein [Caudoviricetes sp.]|nr:MAG: hypothetical protein [Caudoviricetes sp.]
MTKHIKLGVVLNGPPGCGKDTIANEIVKLPETAKRQFKDALYGHTAKHFEVDLDKFIHYASDRNLKDSTSLAGLGGRTPRQALIHVSEDIFKPRYGSDYFGKVEASNVETCYGHLDSDITIIYPDGGFPDEVAVIDSCFDFVIVVRLHRAGFDFAGDSRDYIHLPDSPKRTSCDLILEDNNIEKGVAAVHYLIENILRVL